MTEHSNTDTPQPTRPFVPGAQKYDLLREATVAAVASPSTYKKIFNCNFTGFIMEGGAMEEHKLLLDLLFKPNGTGLKLRPEESQLLLAYFGEILKVVTDEKEKGGKEEPTPQEQEDASCK